MKIYAHRGSSGKYLEMTRLAYEAAIDEGSDGFECDVRLSSDSEVVCIHDSTTKRIAGKKLRVSRNSLKELQSAYELITLNELLDLAISAKKDLLIETKHPNIFGGQIEHKVIGLLKSKSSQIKSAGIEVIVMSFSGFAIGRVKTKWNFCKVTKYYISARFSKREVLALSIGLIARYPSLVKKLQDRGSRIFIWTVNEEVDFELCKKLGVDGVITNFPEIARRYG
ncbi:MAG: glycerophosphodiester phosphodiesterase family protein [Actinobacteria bacterium]|nr:glycerophosphodiester phosphodiesterase family protein [Actinomycetota bacterium]MDA2982197.1 glycerophosphodiester phosphodiesterase family protein [Actinomycetota bacterium]MDA2997029.1 glycerophosphodiester phosphodiesterase family protein [Actinomycetota bacterium]